MPNRVELAFIIKQAAETINRGGIVLLPFDTVYGFVCDPKNDKAVEKIFRLKERPETKTMGTAADSVQIALEYGQTSAANTEFLKARAPGRYTFILNSVEKKLSPYCYRGDTIAIRIPDSEIILSLAKAAGGIIAQTSANKSGRPNCFSTEEIKKQFSQVELNKVDLIVDGGLIENSRPSEIWDLTALEPRKIER